MILIWYPTCLLALKVFLFQHWTFTVHTSARLIIQKVFTVDKTLVLIQLREYFSANPKRLKTDALTGRLGSVTEWLMLSIWSRKTDPTVWISKIWPGRCFPPQVPHLPKMQIRVCVKISDCFHPHFPPISSYSRCSEFCWHGVGLGGTHLRAHQAQRSHLLHPQLTHTHTLWGGMWPLLIHWEFCLKQDTALLSHECPYVQHISYFLNNLMD